VEHRPEGELKHVEGVKTTAMFYIAFPNLDIIINDMIAEGDKTVTRLTMSGTFTGQRLARNFLQPVFSSFNGRTEKKKNRFRPILR